jgi:ABC-type phosphate/phosphonate transport system substrate-binding protein
MLAIVHLIALGVLVVCGLTPSLVTAELKLGVLAPRGVVQARSQWADFASYLGDQLGQPVTFIPLGPAHIVPAAEAGQLDLVLANVAHMIYLKERVHGIPLATLNGPAGPHFAGVILAKKGSGIRTVADLRGKHGMSLKFREAAGAYIFQTYHLYQRGIDPHKDFASLREGQKQDDLVFAVQLGLIDVAFIRSSLLESMEQEGRIKIADFVIVDQRTDDGFDLVHSTDLYPEWYLSALPQVPVAVQAAVKAAALQLTPDMPAAQVARVKGFIEPLSLDGMQKVLKTLNIHLYDAAAARSE